MSSDRDGASSDAPEAPLATREADREFDFLLREYDHAVREIRAGQDSQYSLLRLAFALLAADVALASFVFSSPELQRAAVPIASIPGFLMPVFAVLSWRQVIRSRRTEVHVIAHLLPRVAAISDWTGPSVLETEKDLAGTLKRRFSTGTPGLRRSLARNAGGTLFQAVFLAPAVLSTAIATVLLVDDPESFAPAGAGGELLAWFLVGLAWLAVVCALIVFTITSPPPTPHRSPE